MEGMKTRERKRRRWIPCFTAFGLTMGNYVTRFLSFKLKIVAFQEFRFFEHPNGFKKVE
jgi:hypothetical protein